MRFVPRDVRDARRILEKRPRTFVSLLQSIAGLLKMKEAASCR